MSCHRDSETVKVMREVDRLSERSGDNHQCITEFVADLFTSFYCHAHRSFTHGKQIHPSGFLEHLVDALPGEQLTLKGTRNQPARLNRVYSGSKDLHQI